MSEKKYVEVNDLLQHLQDVPYKGAIRRVLQQAPAADVAPVIHARWIKRGCKWQCTHCKVLMSIEGTPKENILNYCPNCGAKMDGEEGE